MRWPSFKSKHAKPAQIRIVVAGDHHIVGEGIVRNLNLHRDMLAHCAAYIEAQARVSAPGRDRRAWARHPALDTASMGKFPPGLTIRRRGEGVWRMEPTRKESR